MIPRDVVLVKVVKRAATGGPAGAAGACYDLTSEASVHPAKASTSHATS
ncbi:MAG TPA: hypothetical protein VID73_01775 [Ktedonobacterales bacterium]